MGHAGRQFQALLWKNWLCRLRHPVLSLAEILWPCILFMILTVLRFQEPPRHRDSCYLQARDLPSRGIFPFVQSLLCNTGSQCRNTSFAPPAEHHSRLPRFQTAAEYDKKEVDNLAFLKSVQDFAKDMYEIMEKAKNLQKIWIQRSKSPESSYGARFLKMDLNKTEDMILILERLHMQPPLWDFLLSLPQFYVKNIHTEDSIHVAVQFLQAVLNSLISLEDLDWLPLNHTFSKGSESILNVTISTLIFLQEHGVAVTAKGYNLSLKDIVWNPQMVKSDLKSLFGFDDLHSARILNYSAQLMEVPTDKSLESMVCSVLFNTSEDGTDGESHPGDCDSKWSEAKDYLVHVVSWPQVYKQVLGQWQKGKLLEKVLTIIEHSLETLRDQFEVASKPWKVTEALHSLLLLLNDTLTVDGLKSPKILLHLQRLQNALHMLPGYPALHRLLLLDGALRKAMAQKLRFVQEVLIHLETSANYSSLDGSDQLKLEMDMVFWELKQILKNNSTDTCLNGTLVEKETLSLPQSSRIWESFIAVLCQLNISNGTNTLNKLIHSIEAADHILQEVIIGLTSMPVSMTGESPGWLEIEAQLSEAILSCTQVFQTLDTDGSPGNRSSFPDCTDQIISTVIFHTLEKVQSSLEQAHYWKVFIGFIRKTCEVAQKVNIQENFHSGQIIFSEEYPCYEVNMDWKIISANYLLFLNNLLKSPMISISRIFNSTKDLLIMENKLYTLEDEQMNYILAFVEFGEKLLLPKPFNSSSVPKYYTLPSLTEILADTRLSWINSLKSSKRDPPAADTQKLLKFGKVLIEKIQTLENHWIRKASGNIFRYIELILSGINPKLLELWMYDFLERERAKLEVLPILFNSSIPDNEKTVSESFNFSQLFHSDWSKTPAGNIDFVHLTQTIVSSLYEFGFVSEKQVSEALDIVHAIRNASDLFSTLSESQKQEVGKILSHIFQNVIKDKDSALLLQIYFSFYQHIHKFFLSIQNRDSLRTFLTQFSKHSLDILKQFNFQNISGAFAFLSETIGILGRISEVPCCQQLLSIFQYLELQAQSLRFTEDQGLETIHTTLSNLKQLFIVDEDFRISIFEYISQLLNVSIEALLGNECFASHNENISSLNYPTDVVSSLVLPRAKNLLNLSANGSTLNEFMSIRCTISWLQMWMEICGNISQLFKFETNVFTSLHIGLNQFLDEVENNVKLSSSCQGIFSTNNPAVLLLNLLKTVTEADGFHDWNDFLKLRELWVALDDVLDMVKSLHPDKVEQSLLTMETTLHQLKTFPLTTNISKEFLYSVLEIFFKLSNASEYRYSNVHVPSHFLSNNLTNFGAKFQSVIPELREIILFLRNVSHDQDLLSCVDAFQNVAEFVFEDGLLYVNTSQWTVHILALLNSAFSSDNITRRLKGCIDWVDIINHLHVTYNSNISQGHLQGILRNFRDRENKIATAMKLVTWVLNMKEPFCSSSRSNINCLSISLKNVYDFLNAILTLVLEKEIAPEFDILLSFLNNSTNRVRMIISNLIQDFDFVFQSNWTHFAKLILRHMEMPDELPQQFQNIWLHLIALGKEIQKLVKDIAPKILQNTFSSISEKFLNVFTTSPKEKDLHSLENSLYHFASDLVFNLSYHFQNSSKIFPHEIKKAVSLGIQLVRDVFSSLMPTVHHDSLQNTGSIKALKKVSFLMHTLKKTDIELFVDKLEEISENLMDFFENISRLDSDNLGANLLVGLMEKFVKSSHPWNVKHLLKLSYLLTKDDVNALVDLYFALPHAVSLLQRLDGKNITETLKDVYNFTLFHGITISSISKEDFAIAVKNLLDITELILDKPGIVSEALTCLPEFWCWNHTAYEFQQNPKLEACNAQKLIFPFFYEKVTGIIDHLHLSLTDRNLQCSNKSSRMELTRKVVCVIHTSVDWNSILLEMFEVFHIKISFVKTIQEFLHKVLPYVMSSEIYNNGSMSEFCPGGSMKQVALQIIKIFKDVNFTKVTAAEKFFDSLASLNKILHINEGLEVPVPSSNSSTFKRIVEKISGVLSQETSLNSLVSPFILFLDTKPMESILEALSNLSNESEAPYNFEELWLQFEQTMKDLRHNFDISHLTSVINEQIKIINLVAPQNPILQFPQLLERLNSSSLKILEIIEDFLVSTGNWLYKYAIKNYSRVIQTLLPLMANESSTDHTALLARGITVFWSYLKNISKEGNFDVLLLTDLLKQQQLTNFSIVPLLLESIIINSISNLSGNSQEAALNLSETNFQIMNFINLTLNHMQSENDGKIIFPLRSTVDFMEQLMKTFFSFFPKENSRNKLSLLLKDLNKYTIADMSVVEMCQAFQQPAGSSRAIATLQKVKMLVVQVFTVFAENPSLIKNFLCATVSCKQDGIRPLVLVVVQGLALLQDHYQEIRQMWSSPTQLNCESLSRNLFRSLESFKNNVEDITEEDCECQQALETVQQQTHMLVRSLEEILSSGNPIISFLSNFTVTDGVKVKDLMKNVTKLVEELQASIHLSDETINCILEANISHSKVLSNVLTVALSGRCDQDILRLLLTVHEDKTSLLAMKELCALPGTEVYSLLVLMSRNLNLRNFIYKIFIPSEENSLLNSMLDVVSSINSLLPKAQHILEYLPKFLQAFNIAALLDMTAIQQVSQNDQFRNSAFGSFQSVMKMICKEKAFFLSNTNTFIDLPRVDDLLEGDKAKFNIPDDSNVELMKIIVKARRNAFPLSLCANYTFHFVDKIKTLSETLLNMSSLFQRRGNGQMLNQFQEALRNKFVRNFIKSQLHIDVDKLTEKLQTYGGMLDRMVNHVGAGNMQFLGHILVNLSSCVVLNRFQAQESVDLLETKAQVLMQQNDLLASIIFNNSFINKNFQSESRKLPPHVTYTIRTSVLYSMRTDMVKNPFWKFHPQSLPADGFKYNYIFVPLQDMIERAIISVQTGRGAREPATQAQAMPYPCHTSDLFLNNVGFFFPLIMMLTWMVSVASMVRKLVYEREIQIEEYMRMMGVHPTTHFLAWFLENMAMLTLGSVALAVILKTSGIFAHSNALIIFLFLLDFGVSVVMLSYFLSAFFSQANTAALCTSLVYMISFLPYIVLLVLHNRLSLVIQTFLCFLSTTAFGQGVFFITFLEGQEAGTFGLRKPWYFPFTGSYWKNICGLVEKKYYMSSSLFFSNKNFGSKGSSLQQRDGKLEGDPPGVTLLSVTKEYEPNKAAVKDLTVTFHRNQITALLGTNGAGKTTIISMLTGLYPPTSGTIIINGKNLQTDLAAVRMELGVCPQYDVLFDNLTVLEHLVLFASIKAPQWTQKELHQQVNKTLQAVELTQYQHKQTRVLSGGMKRKLSIGIAFIGMCHTVVLDEPTSGVDPCSRRSIWDILLKYREGRTVIFTTHHLDEAEVLSDCIAILQRGQLRCCSPAFCLKEVYGQGLNLMLTKQTSIPEKHDPKDIAQLTTFIQSYIPQAFLKVSNGSELVYTLPKDMDKANFKGFFHALDQNLHHLHLMGYGISDTTLEEVFLMLLQDSKKKSQLAMGIVAEPQHHMTLGQPPGYCNSLSRPLTLRGGHLLRSQMAALLMKRLRHTLRAWKSTLSNLLLPVLFVALAMGLFMVRPLAVNYPPLKLAPGHYERAETYFFSSKNNDQALTHMLLRKFGDQDLLCTKLNPDLKNSSCWHSDHFSHLELQNSCGCQKCSYGNSTAPYLKNSLGHTLLNLSAFNVENYLLMASKKPRLGGWSFGVQIPNQVEETNSNISKPKFLSKVWYNQKGFHSLPSYLNHLNNLILWKHLPPSTDWRQYGITLYSHPYGGALLNEDKILESIRQCGVALCIVLGFSILTASIGSFVVKDRVTGAKRLQHISGLGYRMYWFTNFLYDMIFYLVSASLCVAMILAFQLPAFTFRENLAATALLLALFGYATLPWMYLMSRVFSSSDVAFISYISLNFICGLCTMLMTIMPRLLVIISKSQNLQNIYDVLKWVFTIFPQFCLGRGLIELCYNQIKYDLTCNFGIDSYVSPFEMNFLGWIFMELTFQGTVLLFLRLLLHWDHLRPSRGPSGFRGTVKTSKDIDVEKEQMRVFEGRTSGDILVLYNLSKSYQSFFKTTTAVQDITLGIRRGELKNSFKEILPFLFGYSEMQFIDEVALSSAGEAGILIGYCPQQDALDELLTGWEHLHYYCSLRGIPKQHIPEVSGDLVRRLHLESHVDQLVATYSGGTKRKLSIALALVGKPEILLLDEPSSGMDPCSKRYLWETIMKEVQDGCAVVLTSHSMEECEALCTRLSFMVNGSCKCLGSPQHIKNRFGDGYTVKVWLCKRTDQHHTISECLKLHIPGIQFKGQRLNLLEYHVPKRWGCLADLFKVLEDNKTSLNINHYSINQTTLEQVFINFAAEQQQAPQSILEPSTDYYNPQHLPI
ncbi:PREDICTED: ATP-binding cassette sub-family A member 13-like [Chrysochloris asiatica]|uniref:ATP-binding cassette sub-family A member 13-like n=1 Tax=Chrysochloris asiatica TaxID=185453 RepID=A0A9B0U243_CHRAS|nr:PREDICTED: ATP-binding cassette sub-family A member 13-like [Chrysochloris asiatica]